MVSILNKEDHFPSIFGVETIHLIDQKRVQISAKKNCKSDPSLNLGV